mmetsp:Transcript_11158/g.19515  ORF Transcript_11158/g.19515 Transcript_11158/m.19515 type:complete len:207 (+) Transcript_11158:74-694(+)|eukprot:CAMPEP_0196653084 /NCGR_PEP_ID=MMETSP1086-20130531/2658_1 /TAXON_ID=77921 /ORGANISM="Cyanoptyche  gloeocystis , Strain SAG4.97" /LENGTH=206 /DNA_ID=CAMNT_0041984089 /DNA_START=67 /DNA_END=687 /DNA_ORIENTATION=-
MAFVLTVATAAQSQTLFRPSINICKKNVSIKIAQMSSAAKTTFTVTNSFAAAETSRRNVLAGIAAAVFAASMPGKAFAYRPERELKYIAPIKSALDSIGEIRSAVKAGKWPLVEIEAKKLAAISKDMNIIRSDFQDRDDVVDAEEVIKAFDVIVRNLEGTEDKTLALADLASAEEEIVEFLKIAKIEFVDEDLYDKLEKGLIVKSK